MKRAHLFKGARVWGAVGPYADSQGKLISHRGPPACGGEGWVGFRRPIALSELDEGSGSLYDSLDQRERCHLKYLVVPCTFAEVKDYEGNTLLIDDLGITVDNVVFLSVLQQVVHQTVKNLLVNFAVDSQSRERPLYGAHQGKNRLGFPWQFYHSLSFA